MKIFLKVFSSFKTLIKIFFLILLFSAWSSSLSAATILGTGSDALLGGDLTDPEDDGIDGTDGEAGNWNWSSISASSENSWTGEGAYNVFDNKVGVNNDKWCCNGPTQSIAVGFDRSYVLTHFTIASGNDQARRDPDQWKIQGSNDGDTWTDIYEYNNNGTSPFTDRNQVIKYTGGGDDFETPDAFSYFRYYVTSIKSGIHHQINEIEFFADPDPTLSSSTPADNATSVAVDSDIVLNFSENVDVESGNITIKKTSDDSTIETIDVTGGQVSGSGSSEITINPSSDFDYEVEYYVLIDATAFDDSVSNSYAGISSTTALSFTTTSKSDPTADLNVTGLIDAQISLSNILIKQSIGSVSNRLRYLRQNRSKDNLTNQKARIDLQLNNTLSSFTSFLIKSYGEVLPVSSSVQENLIPEKWSTWSEGIISVTKFDSDENSSSREINTNSFVFGFDKKISDKSLYGFALQYGKSDSNIGSDGTSVDSKNYNFSWYGAKPHSNKNFIEGSFGFGLIRSDLVRKKDSNTLTGSRNGKQIFGSINYGSIIKKDNSDLTPNCRLELGYTELSPYSEEGTDALSYSRQYIRTGLASLGLNFNKLAKLENNSLNTFSSIEYGMDFSDSSTAEMNYLSDTSTIYFYKGDNNSSKLISGELGFDFEVQNNFNITALYKRIEGSDDEHTNMIKLKFHFVSEKKTEYAFLLNRTEQTNANLNVVKNIKGFDLTFMANQSLHDYNDQNANLFLSKKF